MRALFVLLAFTNPALAACLEDEETFMSCQIEDSTRTLQVCFTENVARYAYGIDGATPELELKEPITTLDYSPWGGVGRSIAEGVQFNNDGYSYLVYAGFERMFGDEQYEDIEHRSFGGVRVSRGAATVADLSCDRSSVDFAWGEGLYAAKTNLGQTWDDRAREWVELPD